MAKGIGDRDTVLRIARLRHEDGLSQARIAAELGISAATVSRALKRALDLGLVEIRISPEALRDTAAERALAERFGMEVALVVETAATETETRRRLGEAMARRLADLIGPGEVVGVSDGETTAATAAAARRARAEGVHVVPLLGGIGVPQAPSHPNAVCRLLAERLGALAWELPVPVLLGDERAMRAVLDSPAVLGVVRRMEAVTLALVGVGTISDSAPIVRNGAFLPADMAEAARLGAVGSICARFYDAAGRPIRSPLDARTVGLRLEALARVPRRIAVAVGAAKAPALAAALRGGLVNGLGTDARAARALLEAPG